MIRILHYEYYIEILHWNIFFPFGRTDVSFEIKTLMTLVKYCKQKAFYFEMISIYSIKTNSLKLLKKNNRYVLVLETIRKRNVYEKENVYFKGFWPQVHNFCSTDFFRVATFSEHLLSTACEYWMFLPLTKIES